MKNEMMNDVRVMGQVAVQQMEKASDAFLQMHKQGTDALRQAMEFSFGVTEAMMKPLKDSMNQMAAQAGVDSKLLETPNAAWEKGYVMAKEAGLKALETWNASVVQSTQAMIAATKMMNNSVDK